MTSNYYTYPYGNTSYPQNQPFSDQYSTPATAPAQQAPSSQNYYHNDQSRSRQTTASTRQSATENRSATTQYTGLNFPAPVPVRQATSASHEPSHPTVGVRGPNATGMDNMAGYVSGGTYQSATKSTTTQPRQQSGSGSSRPHDRAEAALSAATGWGLATDTSRQTTSTSNNNTSADYSYSYQKQDPASQQSYYSNQRPPATRATAMSTGYNTTGFNTAAPQASAAPKSVSQRQSTQHYHQAAQNTSSSYSSSYDASSRVDAPTASYQPAADYGKQYQEDTEQSQSYLHRVYTLPQPTPTRNSNESTNSYFPSTHPADTTTYPSSAPPKPSTTYQGNDHERGVQDLGRNSSAIDYLNRATNQSAQQYQSYNSVDSSQNQSHSYNTSATTSNPQSSDLHPPSSQTGTMSQPTQKPKKQRQPASKKSPTAKTPKPRAPRKPKAPAGASQLSGGSAGPAQPPAPLPKPHTFYPASEIQNPHGIAEKNLAPNEDTSGLPIAKQTSTPGTASLTGPLPAGSDPDMASMEQHMRAMVEKMREYQARDPTAFQQVWENVKKAGPGAAGSKTGALATTGSKAAPGTDSPLQKTSTPVKPAAQAQNSHVARQSTPIASTSETGRSTPVPGSAASQAQKTVWPATQKVALSQTASKFLNNLGQRCSESFIMGLLDFGPTFAELCQKLEAQGYKFERNKLAIELLKTSEASEPSIGGKAVSSTAAPAISAGKPSTTSNNLLTGTAPLQNVPPRHLTPQSVKTFTPRNIKDSIHGFPPQDHNDESQGFVAPSMIYREVYSTSLGQLELSVPPEGPAKPQTPTAPAPIIVQNQPPANAPPAKRRVSTKSKKQQQVQKPQTVGEPSYPTPRIGSVAPFPPAPPDEIMVDASPQYSPVTTLPVGVRLEGNPHPASALLTTYVPSNRAEDESTIQRLQSKLEAQMSRMQELASPPKPPPPRAPSVLPSQPPTLPPPPPPLAPKKNILPPAPSFDKKQALRRNNYDPQTIVHAVLLATGRHPNFEGLNSQLAILKRLHPEVFDNNTDLAAIPWDIYDPPPAPLPGEERKNRKPSVHDEEIRGRKREPVPFPTGVLRTEPNPSTPAVIDGKVRGRRGRPRGSRGIPRGRGRGGLTAMVQDSHINAHSSEDTSTATNAHKYGTPRGTRVNIHSLNKGDGDGRKRKHGGSPPSQYPGDNEDWRSIGKSQIIPVFKCQWENCNYELQNLDTLRRHLSKKHRVENNLGVIPCCWGDCGNLILVESQDEAGKKKIEQRRKRLNFGTGTAWDNHVLGGHLKTVKEELGEGMSVKAARSLSRASSANSVEGRMRSMSRDRKGRSVTPVITPAPFGYKFTPPPGFSSGTQFRVAHELDNDAPDEKKLYEDELARVARIGAGMESYGIPRVPGIQYDDGKGFTFKVRRLVGDDWSILPPFPKVKTEVGDDKAEGKGKGRAKA
ncbi:hypothetical protein ABW19_dt0200621 [Dactylella cylindrospora]|nr:hypothetical protein ABW19_dt0200621 [Dactylella cylindrospora]